MDLLKLCFSKYLIVQMNPKVVSVFMDSSDRIRKSSEFGALQACGERTIRATSRQIGARLLWLSSDDILTLAEPLATAIDGRRFCGSSLLGQLCQPDTKKQFRKESLSIFGCIARTEAELLRAGLDKASQLRPYESIWQTKTGRHINLPLDCLRHGGRLSSPGKTKVVDVKDLVGKTLVGNAIDPQRRNLNPDDESGHRFTFELLMHLEKVRREACSARR